MASPTEPSPAPNEEKKPSLEDLWNDRVPSDKVEKYFPELGTNQSEKTTEDTGTSTSSFEPNRDLKKEQHQVEAHPMPTPIENPEPGAETNDPTNDKAEPLPEGTFKPGRLEKGTLPPPNPIPRRPKRPLQPGWVARRG